jgi:hypothetical protein
MRYATITGHVGHATTLTSGPGAVSRVERRLYLWEGPTWAPVRVPRVVRSLVAGLPWPLREVDYEACSGDAIYARADGWRVASWAFWWACARSKRMHCEVLRTAYDLARAPHDGCLMSWPALCRGVLTRWR